MIRFLLALILVAPAAYGQCYPGTSEGYGTHHFPPYKHTNAVAAYYLTANTGNDFEILLNSFNWVDPAGPLNLEAPMGVYRKQGIGTPQIRQNGPRLNNTSHFGVALIKGWQAGAVSGEAIEWDSADGLSGISANDWAWAHQPGITWVGKIAGISSSPGRYILDTANGDISNVGFTLEWDHTTSDLIYSVNDGVSTSVVTLPGIGWGNPSDLYVIEFGCTASECRLIAYGRNWTECNQYQTWAAYGPGLSLAKRSMTIPAPACALQVGRTCDGRKEGLGHQVTAWIAFQGNISDPEGSVWQDDDYEFHTRMIQGLLVR